MFMAKDFLLIKVELNNFNYFDKHVNDSTLQLSDDYAMYMY